MNSWPFKVIEGPSEKPIVVVEFNGEEKKYAPKELSAMVLKKMKEACLSVESWFAFCKRYVKVQLTFFQITKHDCSKHVILIQAFHFILLVLIDFVPKRVSFDAMLH